MRVEDLDPPRVKEGAEEDFLRDHAWLGLDWDEGPYHQSARSVLYERAIERLVALGHVYPCTCSRKEIEAIASAPHGEEGPIYPGTCRGGPSHPGRPAAMRFRMPEPPPAWTDPLAGPVPEGAGRGDFVVRRADGLFAYQLAVVVDDAAMGVTEVVRGSDLLASTPRQLALFAALAETPPTYVHLPRPRAGRGAARQTPRREGHRRVPCARLHRRAAARGGRLLARPPRPSRARARLRARPRLLARADPHERRGRCRPARARRVSGLTPRPDDTPRPAARASRRDRGPRRRRSRARC